MAHNQERGMHSKCYSLSSLLSYHIIVVLVSLLGYFSCTVSGQVPIPRRPLGYVYNSGSPTAPVVLVIYIDLLCPDCRDAFPTVLAVADYYGAQKLRLEFIPFPLAFHRNSYLSAKGIHVVNSYTRGNLNATYAWVEDVFVEQDKFSEAATYAMTEVDIVGMFAGIGESFGIPVGTFVQLITNDRQIEMDTRVEWKYACTRGVAGTPYFTVNDIFVTAGSTWNVTDWTALLNPLFSEIRT